MQANEVSCDQKESERERQKNIQMNSLHGEKSTQNMRSTHEYVLFFISHIVERPYMYFKYFFAPFDITSQCPK